MIETNIKFEDNSYNVLRTLQEAINQAIEEETESIARISQSFCPVKTGNLRNSLSIEYGMENGLKVGKIEYTAPYAVIVEEKYGYKFLFRAVQQSRLKERIYEKIHYLL